MFRPTTYRRADLADLVTLIQLKLPASDPDDPRVETAAERFAAIEGEIRSWAIAKPIIAARRVSANGTRGIHMGDVDDLSRRLADGVDIAFTQDPSREVRIAVRANHSLSIDITHWNGVLSDRLSPR